MIEWVRDVVYEWSLLVYRGVVWLWDGVEMSISSIVSWTALGTDIHTHLHIHYTAVLVDAVLLLYIEAGV